MLFLAEPECIHIDINQSRWGGEKVMDAGHEGLDRFAKAFDQAREQFG
jgi:hypothetical protein